MNRSGRVNFLLLACLVLIGGAVILFLQGGDSPTKAADRFMYALATHDVDGLLEHGYMGRRSTEEARAAWEKTLDYNEYFSFLWEVIDGKATSEDEAIVSVKFVRNVGQEGSYAEVLTLPMIKDKGKWKVEVLAIARDKYPALPR